MYGPYPLGGRVTNGRGRADDPLSRYLRSEYRGAMTAEAFIAEARSLREAGRETEKESAVRRLVKLVLVYLRRVRPVPVAPEA